MQHTGIGTDYEVKNFEEDVIQASYQVPVVVDFWAPWCGPCRMLGPALERLAQESQGKWKLVKVNTDVHQDLAMRYGIRGIPNVKLFRNGQVVDEFTGALPAPAIKQWLEKHMPSEEKRLLESAQKHLEAGYLDQARNILKTLLEKDPNNSDAKLLLAQLIVLEDPKEAEALLEEVQSENIDQLELKEALQTIIRLLQLKEHPEELPEGPAKQEYLEAIEALSQGDFDTALSKFISVIMKDRYYDNDGARKAAVAIFKLLGENHPITRKHRRLFDMSLY